MTLLDTNILIEIYRDHVATTSVVDKIQDIAVSDVVRAELFYGARNKRELQEISTDLEELTVLALLPQISETHRTRKKPITESGGKRRSN